MQSFLFFHKLAILLSLEIVIFMMNWLEDFVSSNSVCNHTRDKKIGLLLRGLPILLLLVWLQTELDSTQSYYHYLARNATIVSGLLSKGHSLM